MPNLVAIVDRTASKEALGADLDRMMDAVDLPAFHFPRRAAIEDGVAAGNVLPGMNANLAQPARSGRRWLMLDGEILGVQALKDDLRRAGREVDTDDDAELAMTAFEVFGPDFYQRMNGTWNMVFHDGDSGATYVVFGAASGFGSALQLSALDGVNGLRLDGVAALLRAVQRDQPDLAGDQLPGAAVLLGHDLL